MEKESQLDTPGVSQGGRRRIDYGQQASIGNPLNVAALGRRPYSAGALRVVPKPAPLEPLDQSGFEPTKEVEKKSEELCYHAYFLEPLLEYTQSSVPYTKERVRKCVVTYFTQDASVSIDEPRTKNSGYVQGKLLKRSHAKTQQGKRFAPTDFEIGGKVEIFGRSLVIVDADARTRTYLKKEMGVELGAAIEYPDDGFEAERARMEIKYKQAPAVVGSRPCSSGPVGRDARGAEMVLRFSCAYQDDRPEGDRRLYGLHYYLSDDTVEIKETRTEGVQNFPNLLRRSVLPRDALRIADNPLTDDPKPPTVSWKDLVCGATVLVWGRPLLLLSCDRRTEAWYVTKGISQQPLQVAPDDAAAFPTTLPPFNGFGAENDLYAMGLSLQPAVINSTQEDYARFMAADNKVLRFECRLARPTSDYAAARNFVINYYLGDDSIMVYEPPLRNSGFTGGVFLTRTRYKKHIPDQRQFAEKAASEKRGLGSVLSRWLRPTDFYEGAEVAFEAPATGRLLHTFKVLCADDYTKRVEQEKNLTAGSRLAMVIQQLAERLCAARVQVRSEFKKLDANKTRVLPGGDFCAALRAMENTALNSASDKQPSVLDDAILEEMCRKFDGSAGPESGASVRYDEFVDALVLAAPMPRLPELKASSTTSVKHKALEKELLAPLRAQMGDAAANGGLLRASFHAEDPSGSGTVDVDAWYRVLRKHRLHGCLSREEAEQLKQRYSEPSELHAGVEYERLCDKVLEGDFQDYMAALLMVLPERGDLSSVDLHQYRKQLEGGNKVPTVKTYLDRVNKGIRDCGGDVQQKLTNTMRAFASAFGRKYRNIMLRRHLMAFDVGNTGSCNRDEFVQSVKRVMAECRCELDIRALSLLASYIFPEPWTRQPYDDLLELLISRDVDGIMRVHVDALEQQEDPRFLFR